MKHETPEPLIMIVGAVPDTADSLGENLKGQGWRVMETTRVDQALIAAQREPPDLIILDDAATDAEGAVERLTPAARAATFGASAATLGVPVIALITPDKGLCSGGNAGMNTDSGFAIPPGCADYVTKPFFEDALVARIQTQLTLVRLRQELDCSSRELESRAHALTVGISDPLMASLAAVLNLAECRDDITGRHIERTRLYCKLLALELRKSPRFAAVITDDFVESIHNAAPLHDIGKIAISDSVLLKEGRLSEAEFAIMRTHVTIGVQALQRVRDSYPKNGFINMGIALTGSHHERWDGKGYPNGLFGENIPISGRIMALADAYDALRSRRPYKNPLTREESLRVIGEESGKQFDPAVVAAFLANEPRFAEISEWENDDRAAWQP